MEPLGEVGGLWDVCAFVQTTATGTIRSPLAFTLRSVGCMYPKGPCTQILYTLAPMYLYRDYFKANVYAV